MKSETQQSMLARVAEYISNSNYEVTHQDVFSTSKFLDDNAKTFENVGSINWPVTWIRGIGNPNSVFSGTLVHAIRGSEVKRIQCKGVTVGSLYKKGHVRFCRIGGLHSDQKRSREEQAMDVFRSIKSCLCQAEMGFSNITRTWFYLDNIIDWYDSFNKTRNSLFEECGIIDRLIPASTGIGSPNSGGSALVAGALAVDGNGISINSVDSPLQKQPMQYGSSFSRAVEINWPDSRLLLISGTASIDSSGMTVYKGDVKSQIKLSMEVVQEILRCNQMDWDNVIRGIAYFRKIEDVSVFECYCSTNGFPSMPVVFAHNTICREDLLFEIEVDAAN